MDRRFGSNHPKLLNRKWNIQQQQRHGDLTDMLLLLLWGLPSSASLNGHNTGSRQSQAKNSTREKDRPSNKTEANHISNSRTNPTQHAEKKMLHVCA